MHVRCLEDLLLHDWPGNVRELELLVRRLLALAGRERTLAWHMLPDAIRRKPAQAALPSLIPAETRAARDIAALSEALRTCNGNIARARADRRDLAPTRLPPHGRQIRRGVPERAGAGPSQRQRREH